MIRVSECRAWAQETDVLNNVREHRELFAHIPSQSRFNRRHQLADLLNRIGRVLRDLMTRKIANGYSTACPSPGSNST